ncbi:hypothetical protein ACVWWO_006425 [Bradyrhizobium sp. F1.13.1]
MTETYADGIFSDLNATHDHEEKLRAESMAIIQADPEFSRRLATIQKAMALIFGYGKRCAFCNGMRYVWKDVRERCDYYCDYGYAR